MSTENLNYYLYCRTSKSKRADRAPIYLRIKALIGIQYSKTTYEKHYHTLTKLKACTDLNLDQKNTQISPHRVMPKVLFFTGENQLSAVLLDIGK